MWWHHYELMLLNIVENSTCGIGHDPSSIPLITASKRRNKVT